MLDDKEIEKIDQLIKQGKSNYRIWKETGHSPNTVQGRREVRKKREQQQISKEDVIVKNPIEAVQKINSDIDALIQTKQLDEREEKKWRKRADELREMQKVEIEDRIPKEREDAGLQRDEQWKKHIEQNYVKKDVATGLEGIIQERDRVIMRLRDENTEKYKVHEQDQIKILCLTNNLQYKDNHIQVLSDNNAIVNFNYSQLQNYIENRLDNEVRKCQEQLRLEQEKLLTEKTDFFKYAETQITNLNAIYQGVEQQRKNVETREKNTC